MKNEKDPYQVGLKDGQEWDLNGWESTALAVDNWVSIFLDGTDEHEFWLKLGLVQCGQEYPEEGVTGDDILAAYKLWDQGVKDGVRIQLKV